MSADIDQKLTVESIYQAILKAAKEPKPDVVTYKEAVESCDVTWSKDSSDYIYHKLSGRAGILEALLHECWNRRDWPPITAIVVNTKTRRLEGKSAEGFIDGVRRCGWKFGNSKKEIEDFIMKKQIATFEWAKTAPDHL